MYKNRKNIIIIAVFAAALIFLIIGAARRVNFSNTVPDESYAMIYSMTDEELASVEVKNDTGEYTIEKYEEKLLRSDGKEETEILYRVKDNPVVNLDQTQVKKLLSDFYEFHVMSLAAENAGTALESYGFTEDSPSVTVNKTDGSSDTFVLGGVLEDEEQRYVKKADENRVYTMLKLKESSFLNGLDAYRQRELGILDSYTLLSFSVTDKNVRKLGIRYKNENDREVVTTDSITYVMTFPYKGAVNIENFGALMKPFDEVYAVDFIEDEPDDLSEYGLDDAHALRAVIQDVEQNRHELKFGKSDEKGNIYTTYNDYDFVFTTEPDMYNAVADINPADYIDKYTNLFDIDEVENVTVTDIINQKTYSLDIGRSGGLSYEINGKEAYDKAFRSVYEGIINIKITSQAEEEKKDEEVLDITFNFTDGSSETSKFYEYDEFDLGVTAADGTYGLVERRFINSIIEILEEFDEDPSVEP